MLDNISMLLKDDYLVQMLQKDNFIGWVYSIDYDYALIVTNDLWKAKVHGIPHNCFLIAALFDPDNYQNTPEEEREIILLRVIGTAKLPQDDDMIRTKIDNYQRQTEIFVNDLNKDFDDITKNMLQFGGLECRVLGTFFVRDNELWLGSDIESFAVAARLNVYRPKGKALDTIVNYVDPIRKNKAIEDARALGINNTIKPFKIGTVRYTSTDRLHRGNDEEKVPFYIQSSDFLARRTAVLGMTRTGKSNMVKQIVSVVKRISDECNVKIGQIIYDINGEYANANQQDQGAISEIYKDDTIRYRMLKAEGFKELQNNFYLQIQEGFNIICNVIKEDGNSAAADVQTFLNTSFDEPDKEDRGLHKRWEVKLAAYQTMLHKAGFEPPSKDYKVYFEANENVRKAVYNYINRNVNDNDDERDIKNPKNGLTLREAEEWFLAARAVNRKSPLKSSSGENWLDEETKAILNMIACKNDKDSYMNGYKILVNAIKYHSPRRSQEVGEEVYNYLLEGKIVILDLSVGDATLRDKISKQIAQVIFNKSMGYFIEGKTPPNIVIYIEEAHNLIGKDMDLTETWPRLAKEGAKYRISLVYATQEVSSIHPNILANTENWFISHLNNEKEVKELSKFYDFSDFSKSILRAQDVGFARVKTLSSPFVVPVQIDKFEPGKEIERLKLMKK